MRTVRCSGRLGGGGVCLMGRGRSAQGGVCLEGRVYTLPPGEQNDWQTGVKT